ncbi:MAG: O-sialoglycoprotein endopeptidase [Clostridia bacterium]|nr:O-sialoglycoprotein endopeptidase [Clostridia bacterium]
MIALGLDTSCYTTSVAFASEDGSWEGERKLLPVAQGERGLRQSEAVFAHNRQLPGLTEALLRRTGEPIGAVCASVAPRDGDDSYMPVFMVGAGYGRSLAAALRVPFFETTHQRGHLSAARADTELKADTYLALHLSGGTTDVLLATPERVEPLGACLDLHAGQLVDRVGVRLGLPFPAGPALEMLAEGYIGSGLIPVSVSGTDCHLSGAEAQLGRLIEAGETPPGQIAAETYDVICRTVLRQLTAASERTGVRDALLFGGVMSSQRLRGMLQERASKRRLPLRLYFGRPELSGDNAVGVARIGLERMRCHGC